MIEIPSTSIKDQSHHVINQLSEETSQLITLAIDGNQVQLSQLEEPIFNPDVAGQQGIGMVTKRRLLQYFSFVSPNLLPLLKDRPITVKRFPNGLSGPAITKHHFSALPEYVETIEMYSEYTGDNERFLLCQNLSTLLWLVDQHVIEIYPWQSRVTADDTGLPTIFINSSGTLDMSVANYPDLMVFNLSPSHNAALQDLSTTTEHFDVVDTSRSQSIDATWERVKEAAFLLQEYLSGLGIAKSYVKISGRGGIHVVVPIERRHTYDYVKKTAQQIGQQLVAQQPDLLTMEWQLHGREGKVFIDCNQNVRNKSVIAAYCPRPNRQATISMPVDWKELDDLEPTAYTLGFFLGEISAMNDNERAAKLHHPWQQLFKNTQALPELLD